jgi:hypothetical protein
MGKLAYSKINVTYWLSLSLFIFSFPFIGLILKHNLSYLILGFLVLTISKRYVALIIICP